jgi:rubrerythrin
MEKFEGAMAATYEWLSELFEMDGEAAAFFARMSRDEIGHRNLVRFQKKLVREDPTSFAEVDIDPGLIAEALDKVETFRSNGASPTLAEALTFAMMMESHTVERLHREAILMSNPAIGDLINSLARADTLHEQELQTFIDGRQDLFDGP